MNERLSLLPLSPGMLSFLDQIKMASDSEDLRAIFADWLIEQGDDRGQFIQNQLELAQTDGNAQRYATLSRQNYEWTEKVRPALGKGEANFEDLQFVDGLLTWATMGDATFPGRAQDLMDREWLPWVEDLLLFGGQGPALEFLSQWQGPQPGVLQLSLGGGRFLSEMQELFSSPFLSRLRELSLVTYRMEEELFQQFVTVPFPSLSGLTLKSVFRNGMSPEICKMLARFPRLGHLNKLDLSGNMIHPNGIAQFLPTLNPHLTMLGLGFTRLEDPDFPVLARAPFLGSLCHLDLSGQHRGPGFELFLQSDALSSLKTLKLRYGRIGKVGGLWLAGSLQLPQLEELDLLHNGVGDEGAIALSKAPWLQSLRSLSLDENQIGEEGIKALAASPFVHNLRSLDLSTSSLSHEAVAAIAGSEHLENLTSLCLESSGLNEDLVNTMLAHFRLPTLRALDLRDNHLSSSAAITLARSPKLDRLTELDLADNPINGDLMPLLGEAFRLPCLTRLRLSPQLFEPRQWDQLQAHFAGRCEIRQ